MKKVSILGSTGSIGLQALDVARKHKLKIQAIAANSSYKVLEEQAREFSPKYVCIYNEKYYNDLKTSLADTDITVLSGMDGLCRIASDKDSDIVLNSVVGMVGLLPTLTAIRSGIDVALANKE
ncbi:MAG: 1-deoxy-D-xylulose-5-phosphate reductoisomerase, partial [Oscillospiraceae bacterium]|nr:1-deoxy-D-xylulose-5-phosphate reductoisomerase [Oscillospiraceae bacterium]